MSSELSSVADYEAESAVPRRQPITVADGLLLLMGALAAVLRLANLNRLPLSPAEAESALGVWRLWQPGHAAITVFSPAYFTLTAPLTLVLGDGDTIMRLVPALFGIGLVLLPWLLRRRLGAVGTLVASTLLAVSPMGAVTARTAGGDAIALFALLLLLSGWVRREDSANGLEEKRWLFVMAGAAALGLTSSALFYSGLATLLLAWWINQATPVPLMRLAANTKASTWRRTAVFGGVLLLALATLFLWYLPGLGSAAALLGEWVRAFTFKGGATALFSPLLALIRYELILLPLGVAAVIWARWQTRPLPRFCALWLATILVLLALQWGRMENAALALLPGYLLLGQFADAILKELHDWLSWLFAAGLSLIWALIFVNIARFSRAIAFDASNLDNLWLVLFATAFTFVTIYFFWSWDWRATNQGLIISVLLLFVFYHWGTAWWLGHQAANDVRERWVQAPATDSDVFLLTEIIHEVSRQGSGDPSGLDLFSAVDSPVINWYLRDFSRLQVGEVVPPSAQYDVIISSDRAEPLLGSDYFGNDFDLLHAGIEPDSWRGPTPIVDTVRWWLFHESTAQVMEERVILWIRADLTQP